MFALIHPLAYVTLADFGVSCVGSFGLLVPQKDLN
jgi:hypothetical protein